MNLYFTRGILFSSARYANCSKTVFKVICNDGVQFQIEIRKISRRRPRSLDDAELDHCYIVGLQRMAKKCTKIYNARAQSLFCLLNLLFGAVLVAVLVVVCFRYK